MSDRPSALTDFRSELHAIRCESPLPADIVRQAAKPMQALLQECASFLSDEQLRPCEEHYARHCIFADDDGALSLYCMVWQPGQWTPVHDHGSWGLVGVLRGAFYEHAYLRVDHNGAASSGLLLRQGGTSILAPGSITSFIPDPDHIHRAGVPSTAEQTVTLHLYGRNMNNYNIYDVEAGTRTPAPLECDQA